MDDFQALRDKYACPCDESVMYDKFLIPTDAEGMNVWFEGDPEPYLDLVLGYSSVNFGHKHPDIVRATQEAASDITQIHSFHTKQKLLLSQYLADKVSKSESYQVYFDIGGASVVSAAMRLCRNHTERKFIVNFTGAYHGVGQQAASVSDEHFLYREQYGIDALSEYVITLPFPSKHSDVSTAQVISQLTAAFESNDVAAVIVEPIQGANGFIIPEDDFLPELRKATQANESLLILDEIQMWLGRTGSFFTYEKSNIVPDIVLLSKSLAGGAYPLSAIIARAELFASVSARASAFQSTFNNNPMGISIALKTMELLDATDGCSNAQKMGELLLKELSFLQDSSHVCNLRGEGLAIAFDTKKAATDNTPAPEFAKKFLNTALEERTIVYACGINRSSIKLAPSILASEDEIKLIAHRIRIIAEKAGLI